MIQICVFILDSRGHDLDSQRENHTSDKFVNVYVICSSGGKVGWQTPQALPK